MKLLLIEVRNFIPWAWAWVIAPIICFVDAYLWTDWDFFVSLLVLISIDTILGIAKAWVKHEVSSRKLGRVFGKVATYLLVLIATHVASTHTVNGVPNALLTWVDSVMYSGVVARELISILEKAGALGIVQLPKGFMKRLKDFDSDTGEPKG